MRSRLIGAGAAALVAAGAVAQASSSQETAMGAPIVYFDIAGPDAAAQSGFYAAVFGWEVSPGGDVSVDVIASPLPGLLRADPAEKLIYLGVEDVTAALEAVVAHGGAIETPRFEVPGVVILGLFRDPAGNRMGLVEIKDGRAVVP
jgi:predicted enzyme related to lactoylglutathione lyase